MKYKSGDIVGSVICRTIIGKIKKYINDKDFILEFKEKEILCNEDFYNLK